MRTQRHHSPVNKPDVTLLWELWETCSNIRRGFWEGLVLLSLRLLSWNAGMHRHEESHRVVGILGRNHWEGFNFQLFNLVNWR